MSQRVNEVELIVKDVEQTVYDNPKKSLIYAHENNLNEGQPASIIEAPNETEASRADQVFHAYTEVSEYDLKEEDKDLGEAKHHTQISRQMTYQLHAQQHLGLFVPNLIVVEDIDQFRYDTKDNRRL